MVRHTRVRDYEKRDGTRVREHERSLAEHDRRQDVLDGIRAAASRRRRWERKAIDVALQEYRDARADGATHDEAMRAAETALGMELDGGDFTFDAQDRDQIKSELRKLAEETNERGYRDADEPSEGVAAKRGPGASGEERMFSVGDAVSDDDEVFSLSEAVDDGEAPRPGKKDVQDAPLLTREEREAAKEALKRGALGVIRGAGFAAGTAQRKLAEARARRVEREEIRGQLQRGAEGTAAEFEAADGVATGPVDKPRKEGFHPSVGVSTRRLVPSAPAAPQKGSAYLGRGDEE